MKHPAGWFWPDGKPWQAFREDRSTGRATRDVVQGNVTRAEAERTARDINARRRFVFGRSIFYAAPEGR